MFARRTLVLMLAVCALVAVGALAAPGTSRAAGGPPEMHFVLPGGHCSGTPGASPPTLNCTRVVGSSFHVQVQGSGANIAGFQSDTLLGGLTYTPKSCGTEVTMLPLGLCAPPSTGPNGEPLAAGMTAFVSPFPVWSNPPNLVDMPNVSCPAVGTYTLTLNVLGIYGSLFVDTGENSLALKTRTLQFYDPDGPGPLLFGPYPVADSVVINCVNPEIGIVKVSGLAGAFLGGACFDVRSATMVEVGTVCDDNLHPASLVDADPLPGEIETSVASGTYKILELSPPPGFDVDGSVLTCVAAFGGCAGAPGFVTFHDFAKASFKIAFASTRTGGGDIYSMNADGTNQTRLTSDPALDESPSWSPDGTKIAFDTVRDGNYEVYTMNADGTNQVNRTNAAGNDGAPAWSPDGTKIAFESGRTGNGEIFVMNADGTNQVDLTNNGAGDAKPAWSPDGTAIIFESDRTGSWDIWEMNANGTSQTDILPLPGSDELRPAFSPDGTTIAFESNLSGNEEVWSYSTANGLSLLSTNAAFDSSPTWKPDGSQIAFMSNRDGNQEIYTMNATGTNQTNRSSNGADDFQPNWSRISGVGADFDQDGCTDAKEAGPNPSRGGLRNPQNFWDFYDVWTRPSPSSPWMRDKVVTILDILGIAGRYGANDAGGSAPVNRNSDPLTPPTSATGYHPDFDRALPNGPHPWDLAPPDGYINLPNDILGVINQYGHSCL